MASRNMINAANLHIGGGVQVASSVAIEIAKLSPAKRNCSVLLSAEVWHNLEASGLRPGKVPDFKKLDIHGFSGQRGLPRDLMDACDAVFTVFGPLYRWRTPFRNIMGFAQPWIIYPENECYKKLPFLRRILTRLKFYIQGIYFRRADTIVVELDHVKDGLIKHLAINPDNIYVVRNCISSIYYNKSLWMRVNIPVVDNVLKLGFVGRNYTHKNTAIFVDIAKIMSAKHGIETKFFVTFTQSEWDACSEEFRSISVNVGPLTVTQCPIFYQALDAVVFPSLLECFSATPLEAMAMEKPLFASDRPFNRDICQDHAHYFDPLIPETAADQIAKVFSGDGPDKDALRAAQLHSMQFSNAQERAERYLSLFQEQAKNKR